MPEPRVPTVPPGVFVVEVHTSDGGIYRDEVYLEHWTDSFTEAVRMFKEQFPDKKVVRAYCLGRK